MDKTENTIHIELGDSKIFIFEEHLEVWEMNVNTKTVMHIFENEMGIGKPSVFAIEWTVGIRETTNTLQIQRAIGGPWQSLGELEFGEKSTTLDVFGHDLELKLMHHGQESKRQHVLFLASAMADLGYVEDEPEFNEVMYVDEEGIERETGLHFRLFGDEAVVTLDGEFIATLPAENVQPGMGLTAYPVEGCGMIKAGYTHKAHSIRIAPITRRVTSTTDMPYVNVGTVYVKESDSSTTPWEATLFDRNTPWLRTSVGLKELCLPAVLTLAIASQLPFAQQMRP